MGDREILAVVKALKVWRHWLEGAKHPFLIWTDHHNLEYIRAVRSLNPRQARLAMFFIRFRFTISYRPGSQNTKADTLSRLYDTEERADPHPSTFMSRGTGSMGGGRGDREGITVRAGP